jgi:prolyl oligopeptidase
MRKLPYPITKRLATTYTKHGVTIPEPYAALEDPNAEETVSFVTAQNTVFQDYISSFPHRESLRSTIAALQNYPRTSAFSQRGAYYYYYHNTGLQNQSVLYRTKSLDPAATNEVFLDPNLFSAEGTSALGATGWSDSQRYFAYGVNEKGSDWSSIRIKDSETGETFPEKIDWVKFSGIAWLKDVGFFYTRFPALEGDVDKGTETGLSENCFLCFHRLGTDPSADVKILDLPDHPKWLIGSSTSDCSNYLIVTMHDGCEQKNLVWVARLPESFPAGFNPSSLEFDKIVPEWEAEYDFLGNDDTRFYFSSTKDAPMKKVVSFDLKTRVWEELVKEQPVVLDFVALVRDTLLLVYLKDARHVMSARKVLETNSEPVNIPIPIGSVSGLSARRDCDFVCLKVTSFLLPGRSLHFDIRNLSDLKVCRDDKLQVDFDPDAFETTQVFYSAKDGVTKIPMFIVRKKGPTNPSHPTLLYGYGGFNISLTPSFSATRIAFLKHLNGTVAIANIRGGGEYGQAWHDAGRLKNKQNCFDDFIEAAKYLHKHDYATPKTLTIMGGSNGGMLVAACANQAPHLFNAVVAQVGVMDALKFHQFTIGHAWTSDYGNPDVEEDFHVALKYSPLHNIKTNTKYPAILCCTGDHDDRVVPLHTLKYLASLQHANPEESVFLGRIEVAAGHGAGKPMSKIVDEAADTYSFIALTSTASWSE